MYTFIRVVLSLATQHYLFKDWLVLIKLSDFSFLSDNSEPELYVKPQN